MDGKRSASEFLLFLERKEVNMERKSISSFGSVKIPQNAQTLNLSENKIYQFDGFLPTTNLRTLILDGNPIISFHGFPEGSSITSLSMVNCPVARLATFAHIAYLAVGPQLQTLNGKPIGEPITSTLDISDVYFRKAETRNELRAEREAYVKRLAEIVRKGWVSDAMPFRSSEVEAISSSMLNEPLTLRIVNLMKMAKGSNEEAQKILQRILDSRVSARPKVDSATDGRIEKQKALISFMEGQLHDLMRESSMKEAKVESSNSKEASVVPSSDVSVLYDELLAQFASKLQENSQMVEYDSPNPVGLKEAVCNLLKVEPSTPTETLISLLSAQGEDA